jgi:SAM-dependent methyltransferase
MTQLHIGCGRTHLEGFINIDIIEGCDLRLDLDRDPLPFPDNSVDLVYAFHSLEHFHDYLGVLEKIWRVMKNGAWFLLEVPYYTLGEYNLVNPFHKTHFSEFSFDFFDVTKLKSSANEGTPVLFTKVWHRFNYMPEFADLDHVQREYARRHLFNVVRSIDFGLYAVKPPHETIDVRPEVADEMQAALDAITAARIRRPKTASHPAR